MGDSRFIQSSEQPSPLVLPPLDMQAFKKNATSPSPFQTSPWLHSRKLELDGGANQKNSFLTSPEISELEELAACESNPTRTQQPLEQNAQVEDAPKNAEKSSTQSVETDKGMSTSTSRFNQNKAGKCVQLAEKKHLNLQILEHLKKKNLLSRKNKEATFLEDFNLNRSEATLPAHPISRQQQ